MIWGFHFEKKKPIKHNYSQKSIVNVSTYVQMYRKDGKGGGVYIFFTFDTPTVAGGVVF